MALKNVQTGDSLQESESLMQKQSEYDQNKLKNAIDIASQLSDTLIVDSIYLNEVANSKTFKLFVCSSTFHAYDQRHLSLKEKKQFLALGHSESHPHWVFGCSDSDITEFGLVPLAYLKLVREIQIHRWISILIHSDSIQFKQMYVYL